MREVTAQRERDAKREEKNPQNLPTFCDFKTPSIKYQFLSRQSNWTSDRTAAGPCVSPETLLADEEEDEDEEEERRFKK